MNYLLCFVFCIAAMFQVNNFDNMIKLFQVAAMFTIAGSIDSLYSYVKEILSIMQGNDKKSFNEKIDE